MEPMQDAPRLMTTLTLDIKVRYLKIDCIGSMNPAYKGRAIPEGNTSPKDTQLPSEIIAIDA